MLYTNHDVMKITSPRHSRSHCLPEVREFFQSSPHSRTWSALNYQQHVTPHMHHVLVDWLCEVANMKLHASKVFHAATQVRIMLMYVFCMT